MATKPKSVAKSPPPDMRGKIVDALMELAAERRFEDISLRDICKTAGVSLADFRDAFPSKGAVLAGFTRRIDRARCWLVAQSLPTTSMSTPKPASTTNTPRQLVKDRIQLPTCGASTGPTPVASISVAKNRARATPECKSRTMDRAITMPAAPPSPWIRRKPVRA